MCGTKWMGIYDCRCMWLNRKFFIFVVRICIKILREICPYFLWKLYPRTSVRDQFSITFDSTMCPSLSINLIEIIGRSVFISLFDKNLRSTKQNNIYSWKSFTLSSDDIFCHYLFVHNYVCIKNWKWSREFEQKIPRQCEFKHVFCINEICTEVTVINIYKYLYAQNDWNNCIGKYSFRWIKEEEKMKSNAMQLKLPYGHPMFKL